MTLKILTITCILLTICGMVFNFNSLAEVTKFDLPFNQNTKVKIDSLSKNDITFIIDDMTQILSPDDSKMSIVCFNQDSATIRILEKDKSIHYMYPLKLSSLTIGLNQEIIIKKGEIIGQYTNKISTNENCDPSQNTKFHILSKTTECPFVLSNQLINCNDKDISISTSLTKLEYNLSCDELLKTNFKLGDTGNKVVQLQKCLQNEGRYKYANGITGYFGNYTKNILNTPITTNKPIDKCNSILVKNYFIAEKSDAVSKLQQCLIANKFFNYEGGATGYYGPITDKALTNYLNSSLEVCPLLRKATYTFGETSIRVKRLQLCLKEAKLFDHPSNTGYFGIKTQTALANW